MTIKIDEDVLKILNEEDNKFNYMLLSRLQQDCEYFLGNGNGYEPHLWAGNVEDQIAKMKELYNKVPEKPEWISMEDINKYEKDMLAKRDSKNKPLKEENNESLKNIDEDVLKILNEGEVVSFMDKLCDLDKHLTESGRYIGMKNSKYGIYKYVRTNQKFDGSWNYDYKLISPEFDEQLDAIDWLAQDLLSKNSKQDFIDCIKEGSVKIYNDSLKIIMDLEDIEEGKLDTNPKFPTGDNKGIDPLPNYMLEPNKSKANTLRREYIQTHGKEYESLNEKVPTWAKGGPLLVPVEEKPREKKDYEIRMEQIRQEIADILKDVPESEDVPKTIKEGWGDSIEKWVKVEFQSVAPWHKEWIDSVDYAWFGVVKPDSTHFKPLVLLSKNRDYHLNGGGWDYFSNKGADDPRWLPILEDALKAVKANNLRREYIQTHGKEYENKLLNEGELISFADFKKKKYGVETEDIEVEEKVNPNEIHVHIDDVTIKWAEGPQDRFSFGKPMSYRDFQELINEEDYKTWNLENIEGGYDKVGYIANITVNGEPDTYEGRIDLGDGKYGAEVVSIKHNMQHFLSKHFEDKKVIVDNPDIDYPLAKYMQKYGTRKENMEKFVQEHTQDIPKGTDYSKKSIDEIAVGDIFVYHRYDDGTFFFKVKRKTPSSVWLDCLETEVLRNPIIKKDYYTKQDEIDYDKFVIPTDKVEECPSWLFIDTDKPFRLKKGYSGDVIAVQSKNRLTPWSGNSLKLRD